MSFIVPVAEASVKTLIDSIDRVIINPIIYFLFAVAMVYFLYGLAQYLMSPDNEEVHKQSKSHMLWGVIGLFIMVAVFGIEKLLLGTFGETKIQINNNGDYSVEKNLDQGAANTNPTLNDNTVKDSPLTGTDIFSTTGENLGKPLSSTLPPGSSYTKSPFTAQYVPNPLCWRKAIMSVESSEYKALQSVKILARKAYISDNNLNDKTADPKLPTTYGVLSAYDKSVNKYYVWWDARAPVGGGKASDCNLAEVPQSQTLSQPQGQSVKPNPMKDVYFSDAEYYRVIDSGTDMSYATARSNAINNALIQIAKLRGLNTTSGFEYEVLPGEKYYAQDAVTGKYDYWVAVQSKK